MQLVWKIGIIKFCIRQNSMTILWATKCQTTLTTKISEQGGNLPLMGKHRALSRHLEQCCQKPSKGFEPVSKGRITSQYVCSCVQVLSHDVHFAIYDIVKSVPITVVDADYNSMMNNGALISFHKSNIFSMMTHYVHVTITTLCVLILCHQRKLYTDLNVSMIC